MMCSSTHCRSLCRFRDAEILTHPIALLPVKSVISRPLSVIENESIAAC